MVMAPIELAVMPWHKLTNPELREGNAPYGAKGMSRLDLIEAEGRIKTVTLCTMGGLLLGLVVATVIVYEESSIDPPQASRHFNNHQNHQRQLTETAIRSNPEALEKKL